MAAAPKTMARAAPQCARSPFSACCVWTCSKAWSPSPRPGGRKIDAWTAQHQQVVVPFDQPGDDPLAFFNANTLAELHRLEGSGAP
jgi:molybdenum cofactor guanylyltransferase